MKTTTEDIKKIGFEAGADLVGVCDAETLRAADPEADAEKFLRGARSIVIAAVADPPYIASAEDTQVYSRLAYPGYLKADGAAASMRAALEQDGFMTCRVEREATHAFARNGLPSKTLPIKKAAELAGMGTIGLNQLLITPEYGPRVRMSAFITDATLEAGKPLDGALCDNCGACVRNCPAGAIREDDTFGAVQCSAYMFGGLNMSDFRGSAERPSLDLVRENIERIGAAAAGWLASFSEGRRLFYYCGACIRLCNGHERNKI